MKPKACSSSCEARIAARRRRSRRSSRPPRRTPGRPPRARAARASRAAAPRGRGWAPGRRPVPSARPPRPPTRPRSGGRPRAAGSSPASRARARRARRTHAAPSKSPARPSVWTIGVGATSSRTISASWRIVVVSRPDEVVGPARRLRGERADDAVGEVLDVDEGALLVARAGDRERLAAQRALDEAREHRGRPCARPVGDAEAQDRRLEAVERRRRRGSTARPPACPPCRGAPGWAAACPRPPVGLHVGVDPDRRGVDDAADPRLASGLQHVERARCRSARSPRRGGRAPRRRRRPPRGGRRRRSPRTARCDVVGPADVADHGVDRARCVPGRRPRVEDPGPVARGRHAVDDVGPDEPGARP